MKTPLDQNNDPIIDDIIGADAPRRRRFGKQRAYRHGDMIEILLPTGPLKVRIDYYERVHRKYYIIRGWATDDQKPLGAESVYIDVKVSLNVVIKMIYLKKKTSRAKEIGESAIKSAPIKAHPIKAPPKPEPVPDERPRNENGRVIRKDKGVPRGPYKKRDQPEKVKLHRRKRNDHLSDSWD